jgi:hypothetical protein
MSNKTFLIKPSITMKSTIVLLIYNVFTIIGSNAQPMNLLAKAWQNTFGSHYLNNWILINQSASSDSISIIEGNMNEYKYTEIESQSKYLSTKNSIVIVDDEDKVIYKMPKSYEKSLVKGIDISNLYEDTTDVTTDSGSVGTKCVLNTTYLGNSVKIQIDTASMLIDWIMSAEQDVEFDEVTQSEKQVQVVQTYMLVSHSEGKEEIGKYLNIDRYIRKTEDGYLGQGIYSSYEIIDLLD